MIDLSKLSVEEAKKIKYFQAGFEAEKVCKDCQYYKPCRHFCLILTRQTDLSLWFAEGKPCPLADKPEDRARPSIAPVENQGLVSIIILARKEPLLQKTIDNLSSMARGPIEFVVVLDGTETEKPRFMPNLRLIQHDKPQGRRPSTNEAAQIATGKYLFHVDAHVKTDTIGWDLILKNACIDNKTMVIPSLDKLILPEYQCKGRRFGHKYITCKLKDAWSNIKPTQAIEPTICGNGMGWFLERDYFWAFGGCDLQYGKIWGNFGLEWALKVWLSDPDGRGPGQVLLSRDVVFAHEWKSNLGYPTPGAYEGRRRLQMWVDGTGPNQVRPFSYFEEHFQHLLPDTDDIEKAPLINKYPAVTAIMNTNGLYPELIEEAIESFNRQDYPNKHLLIVNTNPSPLIIEDCPDDIEIQNIQPFARFPEQIAYAIKQVKTPYWCVMDSDDIFFSNHISQLVELMQSKRGHLPKPGYVIVPKAWEQWKGHEPKQRHRGWWCCLYDRVDNALVDNALDTFLTKNTKDTGFDLHFIKSDFWSKIECPESEITVLHRLGVGFHIRNEHKQPGYYKEGILRAESEPLRPLKPHWRQDYESEHGKPKPIIIRAKNHLGDVICAEPAIRNIKAHFPNRPIKLYCKFPELFRGHPDIDYAGPVNECKRPDYDLKVRRGSHLTDWLAPDLSWKVSKLPYLPIRENIDLFGIDFSRPSVVISTRTHAVHKRWNKEKWIEVVSWLRSLGYQTIQVGVDERNCHCDINLVNKTTLPQLAEICRKSKLYVGIDAGVQHLAVAVGTPAIVLFGPADPDTVIHPGWTYAVQSKQCQDCWTAERMGRECPKGNAACMFGITVDQVKSTIMQAIKEAPLCRCS
jgi:ADP-heptose:LPS heptosyltransferase